MSYYLMPVRYYTKRFRRKCKKAFVKFLLFLQKIDQSLSKPAKIAIRILLLFCFLLFLPSGKETVSPTVSDYAGAQLMDAVQAGIGATVNQLGNPSSAHADVLFFYFENTDISDETTNIGTHILPYLYGDTSGVRQDAALYSIYLTGKELTSLTEAVVSFEKKLSDGRIYLGGLSYTYHKYRLPMNKTLSVKLFDKQGQHGIEKTALYHVVCDNTLFTMADYLAYRSQGFLRVVPKDAYGVPIHYANAALSYADADPYTAASSLSDYLSSFTDVSQYVLTPACLKERMTAFNPIDLLAAPNIMSFYAWGLGLAFVLLLLYALPNCKRILIWIRLSAMRKKKRSRYRVSNRLAYFR